MKKSSIPMEGSNYSDATAKASVCFIIPHKGRVDYLQQTLLSIVDQESQSAAISAIVITQDDNPHVVETMMSEFRDSSVSIVVHHGSSIDTISSLRNTGVQLTASDYVAFVDADIALSPNWVDAMISELHADSNRVIVSAIQTCSANANELENIRVELSNVAFDTPMRFLPGRNLLLRRTSFEQIGGFPEHLETCEDYYFTDVANNFGCNYYTSTANYVHLGEDKSMRELFTKEIWRGRSNLDSMRGRSIGIRELPSFILPLWIPGMLIAALLFAVIGKEALAFVCLLLMLIPFLAYCLRLYRAGKGSLGFVAICQFYAVYFPARCIGMIMGAVDFLSTASYKHKNSPSDS